MMMKAYGNGNIVLWPDLDLTWMLGPFYFNTILKVSNKSSKCRLVAKLLDPNHSTSGGDLEDFKIDQSWLIMNSNMNEKEL